MQLSKHIYKEHFPKNFAVPGEMKAPERIAIDVLKHLECYRYCTIEANPIGEHMRKHSERPIDLGVGMDSGVGGLC